MVTTKNRVAHRAGPILLLVTALMLGGCQPSGPRALFKGEQLIRKGRYAEAVKQLETAVRLLPQNAQAWNHLGLAYHGNGQLQEAQRAYYKALSLDYRLAAGHFNLGCLNLEQANLPAAISELTVFTGLEGASIDGWLKLGAAYLRAGKPDPAEKSFGMALTLQPLNAEALNGLGLAKYQRRRPQEALDCFNKALARNPRYAPALLNVAVIQHQALNNRAGALQKYQQYLALKPRPANWEQVEATVRELESELKAVAAAPPAVRPILSLLKTQEVATATAGPATKPPPSTPGTSRPSAPPAAANVPARTTEIASVPAAKPEPPPSPPPSKPSVVAAKPSPEPAKPAPAPTEKPVQVQVARLNDDLAIKPAQDIPGPAGSESLGSPASDASPTVTNSTDSRSAKRGFFSRINPFKSRSKTATNDLNNGSPPDAEATSASAEGPSAASVPPPPASTAGPLVVQRYDFVSPPKPPTGDRAQAEQLVREGVLAQQAGRLSEALSQYKAGILADPGYFEARFNEGVAAYESGNLRDALAAYEYALAIRPNSADARYNFALALKRANYPIDAAAQFEKLLQTNPSDVRAHYSLATLYAYQLGAPERAKPHFQKVLELSPRHPDAGQIRFWLARKP